MSDDLIKRSTRRLTVWLGRFGFKTGLTLAVICLLCYVVSFAQMALPISIGVKGILWAVFFGLAKTTQYAALIILGKEGVGRIKAFMSRIRRGEED